MSSIEEEIIARRIRRRRWISFAIVCVSISAMAVIIYLINKSYEDRKISPEEMTKPNTTDVDENDKEIVNNKPWGGNKEIRIFREYLRIRTDHPNIDYKPAVEFLKEQAKNLDLPVSVYYPVNNENPVVVMSWTGSQPEMPSILLNSHMDVVPAFENHWTHPPFAANMDENGNIYGRGAQDMKSVGTQYLAAVRALKNDGVKQLKRTIHIIYVPDEEMGSALGMREFVHTEPFKQLNVGFALDEGAVSHMSEHKLKYLLFYAERSTWRIEFICYGTSGHGSIMFENTAAEKLSYLTYKFNELRKIESKKDPVGANTTSINLTVLKGGLEGNVIPPEMSVIYDIRLAVEADHDAFERLINQWCEEAGGNITINFHIRDPNGAASIIDDRNPFWTAFKNATDELNLNLDPIIVSGATDSRFIRSLGIQAFGFSPIINTISRIHGNDEYLNAEVYLTGVEIYKKIIPKLANVD